MAVLNSTEDAHLKSMSPFEADEHLSARQECDRHCRWHRTLLADPHAAVLCYTAISDKGGNIRLLAVEPDLSFMWVCIDRRSPTHPSRSGSCGLVDRSRIR
jgi:hypothetical protein